MALTFAARRLPAILICAFCMMTAHAQRGGPPSLFNRYPFDKWAAENAKPKIRWNVHIDNPHLSVHQRLTTTMRITVDGDELKTRQNSLLASLVRIEDSAGHRYEIDNQAYLSTLNKGDHFEQIAYTFPVFILPGDYVVSFALCDAKTLEHSFTRQTLHVAPLKSDPLPDSWKGLPAVEFVSGGGPPYSWYLPQLRSRIHLPVGNEHPVRVEILVNVTPSDLGSLNQFRLNMQTVGPALKLLTGIEPSLGSVGVHVADLNLQTLTYDEPDFHIVDIARGPARGAAEWPKLRPAFTDFSAAKVDAKTLAGERRMLDYFSNEVTRLLGNGDEAKAIPHVLIVLSAPVYFSHQERPPLPDLPPDPARRVFYLRYPQYMSRSREGGESSSFTDDLERILKPRGARVFRPNTPSDFRKALGAILTEIAAM